MKYGVAVTITQTSLTVPLPLSGDVTNYISSDDVFVHPYENMGVGTEIEEIRFIYRYRKVKGAFPYIPIKGGFDHENT